VSDAQAVTIASSELTSLIRDRDELRRKAQEAMRHAREVLSAGNVSSVDEKYRMVALDEGNLVFNRELGASSKEEKAGYYHQALTRYEEAAALLPDDPRPLLYQGLCYERLTEIAASLEEKQREFALAETVLRKAIALRIMLPDYSPSLPYRALA
jgi:hypothetical protein